MLSVRDYVAKMRLAWALRSRERRQSETPKDKPARPKGEHPRAPPAAPKKEQP